MGILDDVKSVATTIQKIDNIDLYRQILNLQGEILKLVEENNDLRGQISSLKEKFAIREQLIFEKNAYWLPSERGHKTGPLCSNCWDVRRNVVRMHFSADTGYGECPTCRVPVEIEPQDHSPAYLSNDEY
jgi:regulator of replication initiation timing